MIATLDKMPETIMRSLLPVLFLLTSLASYTQTAIKGFVFDKQSQQPLIGANIVLTSIQPEIGTVTDLEGHFMVEEVAPGRHVIQVSYLGYHTITIPNILLTSGKQVMLEIGLEEAMIDMSQITVTAKVEKDNQIMS